MFVSLILALVAQTAYPVDLPAPVISLLNSGRFVATPTTFRIIALSNIADACAARVATEPAAARACVGRTLALALQTVPPRLNLTTPDASHGLWLTHLALILGAGDSVGACLDAKLHQRIVTTLAEGSRVDPLAHVASYPAARARWPADQSATLAALARYDHAHDSHLRELPLLRYQTVIDSHSGSDGLPWSEVAGVTSSGRLSRGCALSFSVRYLSEVDPKRAQKMWQRYRERFLIRSALATGFREWPSGVDRPADNDSGPIVMGIGAAASALGIAAARSMGDEELAKSLETTADFVSSAGGKLSETVARAAASTLAASIRASGKAQPRRIAAP